MEADSVDLYAYTSAIINKIYRVYDCNVNEMN
jgi:hypothetical protein